MTLGTSLLWIVVIGLIVWGGWLVGKKKKWKLVAKIVGGLVALCVVIGLAVWAWNWYQERPQPVSTLGSVSLGMTPVEVSLAIGKPAHDLLAGTLDEHHRQIFKQEYLGYYEYSVKYSSSVDPLFETAETVCTQGYTKIFGLGKFSSEKEVLDKLGTPSNESIRYDGLVKMLSFDKWNVAFEIEKGSVSTVCITSVGKVVYLNEYGSGQDI